MLIMSLSRLVNVRSLRGTAAAFTLAVACLASTPNASAQFGGRAGFEDAFMPDFLARDVTLFIEALGLEDWQRPILENLLSDYKLSFDQGVDGVRLKMNDIKDKITATDPEAVMKQILQPIETWGTEKKRLREEFLENIKSQLSAQQAERWPKFERSIRLEKTLERGELQGEAINLLMVIKELQFAPSTMQSLEPATEEYEIRLDEALVQRQRKIEVEQPKIKDAMTSNNHQAGVAAQESIMSARIVVRDVQDQFRAALKEAIVKVVGEEQAKAFEKAALERGYPKVYRNDPILPLFDSARTTEGITAEQTTALDELQARYVVEIADLNQRLMDAFRTDEPKEPRRRVELMLARQQGGDAARTLRGDAENIAVGRKNREEAYDRYRKAIMEILNEEQKKAMPIFGKGERYTPDEAERIREAKETGARSRAPSVNSPLGSAPQADRNGKKPRKSDGPDRIKSTPGGADPSRDTGGGAGGQRPGRQSAD